MSVLTDYRGLLGALRWRGFALVVGAGTVSGCGHALYAVQANSAERRFEQARDLGAEDYAPYEFHLAREHLEKAELEASEADYGDAVRLSEAAEKYADAAVERTRKAHLGSAESATRSR